MQIIAGALIAGLTFFCLIVVFLVNGPAHVQLVGRNQLPIISFVAIAVFVGDVILSLVLPRIIARQGVQNVLSGKWEASRGQSQSRRYPPPPATIADYLQLQLQTAMIVGLAVLEGAGFFACITYLLEGRIFVLCIIVAIILIMLMQVPTARRARQWMAQQADRIEQLRAQSR